MRDSHTLTRFNGINKIDSPMNVHPKNALECLNVIGDPSGNLWAMRAPVNLIDFTSAGLADLSLSRILSIGLLDDQKGENPPRLIIQQGGQLMVSDAPDFSNTALCVGYQLPNAPARLGYTQNNSVAYFSNGSAGGKLLPGDPTVYRWGIAAPLTPPKQVLSTTFLPVVSMQRAAGVTTIDFGVVLTGSVFMGDPVYVDKDSGIWDNSFAGPFQIDALPTPTSVSYANPGPDSGPFVRAIYPQGLTAATGYMYRQDYGFTKTGHWSTASFTTPVIGPLVQQSPVIMTTPSPDSQVDQAALFRNLDDGGEWLLVDTQPVLTDGPFAGSAFFLDTTTDDVLEEAQQSPPYDNGVSPNGKYVASNVDRVLMCGVPGDLGSLYYSGYDSINFGRPQESWPQFNRLAVGEGQAIPNAIGFTRYGAVIFTNNKDMFIVRGTLSDVTVSAVQTPSFRMDQLPFQIGNFSHYSTVSTKSGVVFLSDAFQLMLFDGYYEPQAVAPLIANVLARITPGTQDVCTSAYVEDETHQWYVLSVAVDGSLVANLTIIVDINQDQERNTGAWVSDLSVDDMVTLLNRDGSRQLLLAQSQGYSADVPQAAGWVSRLPIVYSETDTEDLLPNPSWRSGYIGIKDEDGIDEWEYIKTFRLSQLTCGSPLIQNRYLVDRENYTFANPDFAKIEVMNGYGAINMKGRAVSIELVFPPGTRSAVSALTVSWNFRGKR